MKARLNCESLELRENPAGPVVVDPIAATPTVPSVGTPSGSSPVADAAAIQQILDATLAALGRTW